jgi:hypothetical protein
MGYLFTYGAVRPSSEKMAYQEILMYNISYEKGVSPLTPNRVNTNLGYSLEKPRLLFQRFPREGSE